MKHILLSFFLLGGISLLANAQDENSRKQKVQALYVAYVTQQLKLTETEAQKFWPVHAQFDSEIKAVSNDLPELERQQVSLNIKKKYQDKFSTILGAARADNFYKIDGEFRKKLVDEMRKRRQENNQMNRRKNL